MTTDDCERIRDYLGEFLDCFIILGMPMDEAAGSRICIRHNTTRPNVERLVTHLELQRSELLDILAHDDNGTRPGELEDA